MRYGEFKDKLRKNYDFIGQEKCIEEIGSLKAFRILVAQIDKNELWRREMLFWKFNDRILAIEKKTPIAFKIIKLEDANISK